MTGRSILLEEEAAPHHRLIFAGVVAFLALPTAFAFAHADLPLTAIDAFLPAYAMAVIVINLLTGYIILAHVPLAGQRHLLWLGAGYAYVAAVVSAQMMVFPGVVAPQGLFGAGPQSAIWLWVLWHGGFPAFVLASMIAAWFDRGRPRGHLSILHSMAATLLAAGLAGFFLWLVTAESENLPNLIDGRDYASLRRSTAAIAVVVLNLCAVTAVFAVMRGRTMIALGLAMGTLASLVDVLLTLEAGARFSLGWYTARCIAILSALSVLAVYLRELTWLYARIIRLNARLETQATVDELTGLYNRRHFDRQIEAALRQARRRGDEPVSLLLIDVDHFKRYNDTYGHQAGDDCLRRVAGAIRHAARRPGDVAARIGGEESALILGGSDTGGATEVARRVLEAVRDLAIGHTTNSAAPHVTVSIGLAAMEPGMPAATLFGRADAALYRAKAEGRDRMLA